MFRRLSKSIAALRKYAHRIWYEPLIWLLALSDAFLLIVPTDGLLVSTVLLKPKHWIRCALGVSTGSAIGALILAYLAQTDAASITQSFPYLFDTQGWEGTTSFILKNGAWALCVISMSILPQQPGVVVAALAGMPLGELFISIWIGRTLKYGFFAYLSAYAPGYVKRLWLVRKELQDLGAQ